MSSFRGFGTMQSSQGFRGISRSLTARFRAQWSIRWTLWTVVVLQALILILSDMDSATLQQLLVELLQMPGGQLLQLNVPNAGDRIGLDDQFIPVGRGGADIGLGVELVPGA